MGVFRYFEGFLRSERPQNIPIRAGKWPTTAKITESTQPFYWAYGAENRQKPIVSKSLQMAQNVSFTGIRVAGARMTMIMSS